MGSVYLAKLCLIILFLQKGEVWVTAEFQTNACFGEIIPVTCSANTRPFILSVYVGAKEKSRYNDTNLGTCKGDDASCCKQESNDCYGPAVFDYSTDQYPYHKTYTGVPYTSGLPASRTRTSSLNCFNATAYPDYTTYMVLEYRCYFDNLTVFLNSGRKENNGQGSALYLSSGSTASYTQLPANNFTCSVETDCEGTLTIASLDFRLANDSMDCITENQLIITDGSSTMNFGCSSNNLFKIANLYNSVNSYIEVVYVGQIEGGHLWLELKPSNIGNLSVSCPSQPQQNNCKMTTTDATTSQTGSEESTPTTSPEMTTIETTMYKNITTFTDSTTSHNMTTMETTTFENVTTFTDQSTMELTMSNGNVTMTTTTQNFSNDITVENNTELVVVLGALCGLLFVIGVILLVCLIRMKKAKTPATEQANQHNEETNRRRSVEMKDTHSQTNTDISIFIEGGNEFENHYVFERQEKPIVHELREKELVDDRQENQIGNERQENQVVDERQENQVVDERQKNQVVDERQENQVVDERQEIHVGDERLENYTVSEGEEYHSVSERQEDQTVDERREKLVVNERQDKSLVDEKQHVHVYNGSVEKEGKIKKRKKKRSRSIKIHASNTDPRDRTPEDLNTQLDNNSATQRARQGDDALILNKSSASRLSHKERQRKKLVLETINPEQSEYDSLEHKTIFINRRKHKRDTRGNNLDQIYVREFSYEKI